LLRTFECDRYSVRDIEGHLFRRTTCRRLCLSIRVDAGEGRRVQRTRRLLGPNAFLPPSSVCRSIGFICLLNSVS
jgi:hypothetical protein